MEIAAWLSDPSHSDSQGRSIMTQLGGATASTIAEMLAPDAGAEAVLRVNGTCRLATIHGLGQQNTEWWRFLGQFASAMKNNGVCDTRYADALAKSFHEMADNVIQHADVSGQTKPRGVAGWHVQDDIAAFAVIDLGNGIRHSLQSNPKFQSLASDQQALRAVVIDHATRKRENRFGDGYNTVVQNFVSRNGCLCVRSGAGELIALGSIDQGNMTLKTGPHFRGTRVGAWCAPLRRTLPTEPSLD